MNNSRSLGRTRHCPPNLIAFSSPRRIQRYTVLRETSQKSATAVGLSKGIWQSDLGLDIGDSPVLTTALIEKGVCGLAGKKTNEGTKEILYVSFTVWLGPLNVFGADAHRVHPGHEKSRVASLG